MKKDHTQFQFFSSLMRKPLKAAMLQISLVGIVHFILYKNNYTNICLARSERTVLRFPFFNSIFKNLWIRQFFVSNRKYIQYYWTQIKYAFCPMKYNFNKRFEKLRIVWQIIRRIIFVLKIVRKTFLCLIYITDKPIANFLHFNCKILNISIVNRDRFILI